MELECLVMQILTAEFWYVCTVHGAPDEPKKWFYHVFYRVRMTSHVVWG